LPDNRPLLPRLAGNDEIAELDQLVRKLSPSSPSQRYTMKSVSRKAADVICGIDEALNITSVNPACRAVWEYEQAELVGKNIFELIHPRDVDRTREMLQRSKHSKSPTSFENMIKCGSGKDADMLWSASWSEKDRSYVCIVHDISEAKTVERMRREFVQMISHDLRAPLTSLSNVILMVTQDMYGQVSDESKAALQSCQVDVERLIRLINDLLDIERMEEKKLELEMTDFQISYLIDHAFTALDGLARSHDVRLERSGPDVELALDPDRIVQVLINMISNAIKFSKAGSPVKAVTEVTDSAVTIKILDSGPGMPKEALTEIFERFKQVKNQGAGKAGSSGLGLAICKNIVEAHGGQIGVESEVGNGSTFWFSLPRKPVDPLRNIDRNQVSA
ncbi:MAG TPA: PAS domain-containing sensor histidine kinase, partial [Chroococcales cyanobacterium]